MGVALEGLQDASAHARCVLAVILLIGAGVLDVEEPGRAIERTLGPPSLLTTGADARRQQQVPQLTKVGTAPIRRNDTGRRAAYSPDEPERAPRRQGPLPGAESLGQRARPGTTVFCFASKDQSGQSAAVRPERYW